MRWSIRYQLLVPILTLLLGVVGGSTWLAVASARRAAERQIEEQIRNIGTSLAEGNYPLTPRVLEQIKSLSGADYVVASADGQMLTTLPAVRRVQLPPASSDDPSSLRLGPRLHIGGEGFLLASLGLRRSTGDSPATLYILYPEARWRDALWEAMLPSLWLGGIGGIVAVSLAIWIAHRLTRRITELKHHTHRIADGDFAPLPLPWWNDELRDLARSVNEMAQQLDQLQETVKNTERLRLLGQVSGGVVHHLRNGVTGARLALQVHTSETEDSKDREALDVALRQLRLVEERLQRFLQMGREAQGERRPCDLTELLEEAVELLQPRCRHQQIGVHWERRESALTVSADANQLGHLFVNVIDNAIEAAGPGGSIELRLKAAGEMAVIDVLDSGSGPSAEVADRLFDQFVTSKPEGVGLGLAVARQVAEAHGGSISWRREGNRTCFTIRLPLCTLTPKATMNREPRTENRESCRALGNPTS